MRIINFGSLNIDKVYQVEQFVRPGQTITAKERCTCPGLQTHALVGWL